MLLLIDNGAEVNAKNNRWRIRLCTLRTQEKGRIAKLLID